MVSKIPQAPKHLAAESRRTWRRVLETYDLGPDQVMTLQAMLENWDRAQQAREILAKNGGPLLVEDGRTKRHPAIDVEKQAYSLFQRLQRTLGIDLEPPGPVGRPPGAGGAL